MRKSNIIIIAILVVASIFFLWLWNSFGFHIIDMRDLIITIIWWVLIIALCYAIHRVESTRRERIRTVFVAKGSLYNVEAGIVEVDSNSPAVYVDAMRALLDDLEYGNNAKPTDNERRMRFAYIVHSTKFADGGNTWKGDVVQLGGHTKAFEFKDADELRAILSSDNL